MKTRRYERDYEGGNESGYEKKYEKEQEEVQKMTNREFKAFIQMIIALKEGGQDERLMEILREVVG